MVKQSYVAMASWIVDAAWLYPSTKRVLGTMLAYCSPNMTLRKTMSQLARLSHCSRATVQQAIAQLQEHGLLLTLRRHRYSPFLGRIVYAANVYRLVGCGTEGGYVLVPRELFAAPISHSAFVVALHIYRCAGRKGRCWPSLTRISKVLDMAKATVCRAMAQLRAAQLLVRLWCVKVNHAHSCNSYYPTAWVRRTVFSSGGSLIFRQPLVTRKITRDHTQRDEKIGVGQFSILHKFWPNFWPEEVLLFDGTGVRVYAMDTAEAQLTTWP